MPYLSGRIEPAGADRKELARPGEWHGQRQPAILDGDVGRRVAEQADAGQAEEVLAEAGAEQPAGRPTRPNMTRVNVSANT